MSANSKGEGGQCLSGLSAENVSFVRGHKVIRNMSDLSHTKLSTGSTFLRSAEHKTEQNMYLGVRKKTFFLLL